MKQKTITGRQVLVEKTTGKAKPAFEVQDTALGQNAKAKSAPSKNEPSKPLSLNFSESLTVKSPLFRKTIRPLNNVLPLSICNKLLFSSVCRKNYFVANKTPKHF